MAWWLEGWDERRRHIGAAVGMIGDDDPPTYRVGTHLIERTFTGGRWDGPEQGRPDEPADFLRAICSCGWRSDYLPDRDRLETDSYGDFETEARARWAAHALSMTYCVPPQEATDKVTALRDRLRELCYLQPLAALSLVDDMRDVADEAEVSAVATARGEDISWEEIARAAGRARQVMWRKYRTLPTQPPAEPAFPPPPESDDNLPVITEIPWTER